MDRRPRCASQHLRHRLHIRPHQQPDLDLLHRLVARLRNGQIQRRRPRWSARLRSHHVGPDRRLRPRLWRLLLRRLGRRQRLAACVQPGPRPHPHCRVPRRARHDHPVRWAWSRRTRRDGACARLGARVGREGWLRGCRERDDERLPGNRLPRGAEVFLGRRRRAALLGEQFEAHVASNVPQ